MCNRIFKTPVGYEENMYEEKLILVKYGGFTGEDVRNMPIYERRFHLKKISEYMQAEKS